MRAFNAASVSGMVSQGMCCVATLIREADVTTTTKQSRTGSLVVVLSRLSGAIYVGITPVAGA